MLTWHRNSIPENEIWIKIGGDHGRNSIKFTLQIGNTHKPNSQHNTIVIALPYVRDFHENIVRFLEGGLGDELAVLQDHIWRGKNIKVFLNGDYHFLCKVYGLSGPQGTYPCLWCVVHRQAMSTPSPETQQRTLDTLIADNDAYRRDNRDKKEAAKYNNCLHTPLLQIQLDKVVPPYLHILLGIVLKHHKHLEDAAHTIDKKITQQLDIHLTELGNIVKQYGAKWQQAQELQKRLEYEQGCLVFSERAEDVEIYKKQVESTEHTLSPLQDTELTPRSGPVASSLDTILTKYRITPQAFHSRSFIGDHCHKYTTPDVYQALTQTIVSQTQACTDNPMVTDEAFKIKFQFDDINETFSQVHKAISHADPIQEQSVPAIQTLINNYMIDTEDCTLAKQYLNNTYYKVIAFHTFHTTRLDWACLGSKEQKAHIKQ
ncbi:amine oxidase [Plakobranchus ocellatus]|uniref:Amine oxidase n=1 Tax=Plakobranchus ocellatus TaxID=259542 RepID=A0AAV3ZFN2_9GAST|nr:amine oxidase [Plakobranchus ocellatus]